MQQIEGRPRIVTLGDAKPAVVVSRVQDQGEAIVDLCDEFVGFGRDQGEGLEASSVRPLPRVPDGGEGKRAGFGEGAPVSKTAFANIIEFFLDWAKSKVQLTK